MKTTSKHFSNAFCILVLLLVSHVETVKLGFITHKNTIFNKITQENFLQTTQTLDHFVNKWIRIKNTRTKKCIRIASPNSPLHQADCTNSDDFFWMLTKNQDNSYLVLSKTGNYVFENNGSKTDNGNSIFVSPLSSSNIQKWYVTSFGANSYRLTNQQSKKCIDLRGGTFENKAVIQLWTCADNLNQGWEFDVMNLASCHSSSPQVDVYLTKPIQIFSTKTGKCLKYSINNKITQFDCDSTGDFAWEIIKNDDDTFSIKSFIGDYFFDNNNSKTKNGNEIISSRKYGGLNQKWKIKDFSTSKKTFKIKSKQAKKCLDLTGGSNSNGTPLQLWDCTKDNANQEFSFRVVKPVIGKDVISSKYVGKVVTIQNPITKKCLKFNKPNSRLVLDDCKNTPAFGWTITYNSNDNTYFLTSLLGNFVFDNSRGSLKNGNEILSWSKHGGDNQRWYIDLWNSSSFFIKGKQSGKCIDNQGGKTNNVGIQLWDCQAGNINQNWVFNTFIPPKENEFLKQFVGKWVQIQNPRTGKCLRFVKGYSKLVTYDCENLKSLAWQLNYKANEHFYKIKSNLGNFVLETSGGQSNNGNSIVTSLGKTGKKDQKWGIEPFDKNSFVIKGLNNNKCLDIPGGKSRNMQDIQIWDCQKDNTNQNFLFKLVDPNVNDAILKGYVGKWFRIQNPMSGKCLKFTSADSKLMQGICEENDEEAWQILKNDDETYTIISKKGNYAIENSKGSNENGNPIFTSTKTNGENQKWYIIPWGLNIWRLIEKNTGKSLEVPLKINSAHLWESMKDKNTQGFVFLPFGEKIKIRGFIKNATNNQNIPNGNLASGRISIRFSSGDKFYNADLREGSIYEVTLPKGTYTRTVSLEKYSSMTQTVNFMSESNESNSANIIFMSPHINGWRVVLTWGNSPKDLDSHLILPNGEDVMYNLKKSKDGFVSLDVDARSGFGPETTTLKDVKDGIYKYYINNYSKESPLSSSNAKVSVFHGQHLLQEIKINAAPHPTNYNWWHVLNIDAKYDKLIVINQVKIAMN